MSEMVVLYYCKTCQTIRHPYLDESKGCPVCGKPLTRFVPEVTDTSVPDSALGRLSFILFGESGRPTTEIVDEVKKLVRADAERAFQSASKRPMTLRELVEENCQVLDLELRKAIIHAADAGYHKLTLTFATMFSLLRDAKDTYPWKE